nr:hypothetical protein [Saccharopolyspora sp. ASAGF58]
MLEVSPHDFDRVFGPVRFDGVEEFVVFPDGCHRYLCADQTVETAEPCLVAGLADDIHQPRVAEVRQQGQVELSVDAEVADQIVGENGFPSPIGEVTQGREASTRPCAVISRTGMDRVERATILPFSLVRPAVVYCRSTRKVEDFNPIGRRVT